MTTGRTPYEKTARVLRARGLGPRAKLILAIITDEQWKPDPDLGLREIARRAGVSVATVQRHLRPLVKARLVRMLRRPGRTYVFVPMVDQLDLEMTPPPPAVVQPPLPLVEFTAVRAAFVRGAQGRFVAAEVLHRSGQIDRTSVEKMTGPEVTFAPDLGLGGPVKLTGGSGQIDRTSIGTQICTKERSRTEESPRSRAVSLSTSDHPTPSPAIRFFGVPMTDEQRRQAAYDPAADGNYKVLVALALHLGRDPVEAKKYLAVPVATEADLLEATKRAAAQTDLRYDLTTKEGEGIVHMAVKVVWRKLVREGVLHEPRIELPSRRRRKATP